MIDWAQVLLTGTFTAVAAGIGAFWGGRPLIKYAKQNYLFDKKEKIICELLQLKRLLELDFKIICSRPELSKQEELGGINPDNFPPLITDHNANNLQCLQHLTTVSSLVKVHFPELSEFCRDLEHKVKLYTLVQESYIFSCFHNGEFLRPTAEFVTDQSLAIISIDDFLKTLENKYS